MYFITAKSLKIFTIGIYGNQLYGFQKKNTKLYIYQKPIFDVDEWKIFFIVDINVMKSLICKCSNGIHLASALIGSKIWIAGKKNWSKTYVFSIDILCMELKTFKVFENRNDFISPFIPCHKCSMPYIRIFETNPLRFIISPNHVITKKPHFLQLYSFTINLLNETCYFDYHGERYIKDTILSNVAINEGNEILFANRNSTDCGIENFSVINGRMHKEKRNKFKSWMDVVFFNDGGKNYCFAKFLVKNDNIRIGLYAVTFSYSLDHVKFAELFNFKVDLNFPIFNACQIFVSSNFFVFQSSQGIVTIPKRMLSLSEFAYISLSKIPEPPKQEVKISIFKKIMKLFSKRENKSHPWMSLNFIIDTLNLSSSFSLIHLPSDCQYY